MSHVEVIISLNFKVHLLRPYGAVHFCLPSSPHIYINTDVSCVVQLRGAGRLHTWRQGMDIEPNRISDSGVQFEKHKCCLDFKHSEW
nr:hypothetical protein CFP56_67521 [Quercus suber]